MSDQINDVIENIEDISFEPGSPTHTAELFRTRSKRDLGLVPVKYVENIGWHVWTGKVWAPDPEGLKCQALIAQLIKMLNNETFGQAHNKKYTWEGGYLSNIMGALKITTQTPASDMDALPSYLNCQNGVLDLTTFKLEPHDPSLNLTMITEAEYHDDIDPLWSWFIEDILPDQEVREYLQRLVGHSLLGAIEEHVLPILQGSGSNGKSTFMDAVEHAMGSYAHVAESTLLMSGAGDAQNASPATIMLRGKRIVFTSETEEGKKLASAFVKQITGGDKLTARALHKMPVSWKPTHSVFLLTNPMPIVDGSDQALFRRLKVISFKRKYEKDQIDNKLGRKLERISSSILAWAVEGLKDYQANGIQEPDAVTNTTDEYRGENDALSTFITQYLEFGPGTTLVAEVRDALHSFQQDTDVRSRITSQKLNRTLREHGAVESRQRRDGKVSAVWNGVKLKSVEDEGISEL